MQKDTISSLLNNLKDPASDHIKRQAEKVAGFETGVLLYGETGTGKDFWADYIQSINGREKMLNLNCGDVPEHLLESEWFGYSKGAFTGAGDDHWRGPDPMVRGRHCDVPVHQRHASD